jgi:hypothetical protein
MTLGRRKSADPILDPTRPTTASANRLVSVQLAFIFAHITVYFRCFLTGKEANCSAVCGGAIRSSAPNCVSKQMGQLVIYYGVPNSQPVRAVVWLLLIKRLPFLLRAVWPKYGGTAGSTASNVDDYERSVNPRGTIPAMDDDGFILWESHAIMIYLCEKARLGRPVASLGAGPQARQQLPAFPPS